MHKFGVVLALESLREAREKWGAARTEFMAGYDVCLRRLLHEGAANYMSAAEIAVALGVSTKTVRAKMRSVGLDPKTGKRVLSKQASEALVGNAELLGIDPHDMDLMSPLAYLPMGSVLKRELQQQTQGVTELEDETVTVSVDDLRVVLAAADYVNARTLLGPVDRMSDAVALVLMKRAL